MQNTIIPAWVWEPNTVDAAAFAIWCLLLLVGVAWVALKIIDRKLRQAGETEASRPSWQHVARQFCLQAGAFFITLLGLYVGYATFRTTNMMAALQYVSGNGALIAEMEREVAEINCLYTWGDEPFAPNPEDPTSTALPREGCGREIFVATTEGGERLADSFDDLQLYIEESLLFFIESRVYDAKYGADFYQGLGYWTQDLSADATGAVSFYIMSREIDAAENDPPPRQATRRSLGSVGRGAAEAGALG